MNINELKEKLEEKRVNPLCYGLKGGDPGERLCLEHTDKWRIYYSERGIRTGITEYDDEDSACKAFLLMIEDYYDTI